MDLLMIDAISMRSLQQNIYTTRPPGRDSSITTRETAHPGFVVDASSLDSAAFAHLEHRSFESAQLPNASEPPLQQQRTAAKTQQVNTQRRRAGDVLEAL